jgi:hypothetical protein
MVVSCLKINGLYLPNGRFLRGVFVIFFPLPVYSVFFHSSENYLYFACNSFSILSITHILASEE